MTLKTWDEELDDLRIKRRQQILEVAREIFLLGQSRYHAYPKGNGLKPSPSSNNYTGCD